MARKSIAQKCLQLSGLFEAELLTELMLRFWKHPLVDDASYRNHLLENAAEVLRASIKGQELMEDVPPDQMNFVTSLWYAEWNSVNQVGEDPTGARQAWLDAVRRALPSCFCPQDHLG